MAKQNRPHAQLTPLAAGISARVTLARHWSSFCDAGQTGSICASLSEIQNEFFADHEK